MKNKILSAAMITVATLSAGLTSCSKDKMMTPQPDNSARSITFENVNQVKKFSQSGIFKGNGTITTPEGKKVENLILPDGSTKFDFYAGKGQRIAFAMMFGASKDWFFASKDAGIALYDDKGQPRTGEITSDISLWDNGTKNDTNGNAENGVITSLFARTKPQDLMKLMLSYDEKTSKFTLTITNTSKGKKDTMGQSLETPFSPGVWAVANVLGGKLLEEKPFFEANKKSSQALTTLSQTGNPEPLSKELAMNTGIITGLSPAVVVIYNGEQNPIYELGKKDAGIGLKDLSQKGMFDKLQSELKKISGVKEVYIAGNAPVAPSAKVTTTFVANQGDKIAYALMFGYSNDWFFGSEGAISATTPANLTPKTLLLDNGTGIDQFPGAGNKQALFGGTSDKEDAVIRKVGNEFPIPQVSEILKVTLN
ncbi:MAG: spondin domain-containing protein [Capnocytophaga sp.]|nr:spondin domain-containing protein [Capnocytophaga sp.]